MITFQGIKYLHGQELGQQQLLGGWCSADFPRPDVVFVAAEKAEDDGVSVDEDQELELHKVAFASNLKDDQGHADPVVGAADDTSAATTPTTKRKTKVEDVVVVLEPQSTSSGSKGRDVDPSHAAAQVFSSSSTAPETGTLSGAAPPPPAASSSTSPIMQVSPRPASDAGLEEVLPRGRATSLRSLETRMACCNPPRAPEVDGDNTCCNLSHKGRRPRPIDLIQFVMQSMHRKSRVPCSLMWSTSCRKWMCMGLFLWISVANDLMQLFTDTDDPKTAKLSALETALLRPLNATVKTWNRAAVLESTFYNKTNVVDQHVGVGWTNDSTMARGLSSTTSYSTSSATGAALAADSGNFSAMVEQLERNKLRWRARFRDGEARYVSRLTIYAQKGAEADMRGTRILIRTAEEPERLADIGLTHVPVYEGQSFRVERRVLEVVLEGGFEDDDAGYTLAYRQRQFEEDPDYQAAFLQRLSRPRPALRVGGIHVWLGNEATARRLTTQTLSDTVAAIVNDQNPTPVHRLLIRSGKPLVNLDGLKYYEFGYCGDRHPETSTVWAEKQGVADEPYDGTVEACAKEADAIDAPMFTVWDLQRNPYTAAKNFQHKPCCTIFEKVRRVVPKTDPSEFTGDATTEGFRGYEGSYFNHGMSHGAFEIKAVPPENWFSSRGEAGYYGACSGRGANDGDFSHGNTGNENRYMQNKYGSKVDKCAAECFKQGCNFFTVGVAGELSNDWDCCIMYRDAVGIGPDTTTFMSGSNFKAPRIGAFQMLGEAFSQPSYLDSLPNGLYMLEEKIGPTVGDSGGTPHPAVGLTASQYNLKSNPDPSWDASVHTWDGEVAAENPLRRTYSSTNTCTKVDGHAKPWCTWGEQWAPMEAGGILRPTYELTWWQVRFTDDRPRLLAGFAWFRAETNYGPYQDDNDGMNQAKVYLDGKFSGVTIQTVDDAAKRGQWVPLLQPTFATELRIVAGNVASYTTGALRLCGFHLYLRVPQYAMPIRNPFTGALDPGYGLTATGEASLSFGGDVRQIFNRPYTDFSVDSGGNHNMVVNPERPYVWQAKRTSTALEVEFADGVARPIAGVMLFGRAVGLLDQFNIYLDDVELIQITSEPRTDGEFYPLNKVGTKLKIGPRGSTGKVVLFGFHLYLMIPITGVPLPFPPDQDEAPSSWTTLVKNYQGMRAKYTKGGNPPNNRKYEAQLLRKYSDLSRRADTANIGYMNGLRYCSDGPHSFTDAALWLYWNDGGKRMVEGFTLFGRSNHFPGDGLKVKVDEVVLLDYYSKTHANYDALSNAGRQGKWVSSGPGLSLWVQVGRWVNSIKISRLPGKTADYPPDFCGVHIYLRNVGYARYPAIGSVTQFEVRANFPFEMISLKYWALHVAEEDQKAFTDSEEFLRHNDAFKNLVAIHDADFFAELAERPDDAAARAEFAKKSAAMQLGYLPECVFLQFPRNKGTGDQNTVVAEIDIHNVFLEIFVFHQQAFQNAWDTQEEWMPSLRNIGGTHSGAHPTWEEQSNDDGRIYGSGFERVGFPNTQVKIHKQSDGSDTDSGTQLIFICECAQKTLVPPSPGKKMPSNAVLPPQVVRNRGPRTPTSFSLYSFMYNNFLFERLVQQVERTQNHRTVLNPATRTIPIRWLEERGQGLPADQSAWRVTPTSTRKVNSVGGPYENHDLCVYVARDEFDYKSIMSLGTAVKIWSHPGSPNFLTETRIYLHMCSEAEDAGFYADPANFGPGTLAAEANVAALRNHQGLVRDCGGGTDPAQPGGVTAVYSYKHSIAGSGRQSADFPGSRTESGDTLIKMPYPIVVCPTTAGIYFFRREKLYLVVYDPEAPAALGLSRATPHLYQSAKRGILDDWQRDWSYAGARKCHHNRNYDRYIFLHSQKKKNLCKGNCDCDDVFVILDSSSQLTGTLYGRVLKRYIDR